MVTFVSCSNAITFNHVAGKIESFRLTCVGSVGVGYLTKVGFHLAVDPSLRTVVIIDNVIIGQKITYASATSALLAFECCSDTLCWKHGTQETQQWQHPGRCARA